MNDESACSTATAAVRARVFRLAQLPGAQPAPLPARPAAVCPPPRVGHRVDGGCDMASWRLDAVRPRLSRPRPAAGTTRHTSQVNS